MFSAYADLLTVAILVLGVFMPLTIKAPSEFNEGQRTKVTCTALYTCAKHTPTITWNRDSLQISTNILKERNTQMKYVSTLTFIASAKDSGKSLTCNAQFSNGYSQGKSVTLLVRSKYDLFHFTNLTLPCHMVGRKHNVVNCRDK